MSRTRLYPKLLTVLKEGYSRKQLYHDLVAGVIVGIVALPLAIAFAIASGVKPEQGLYTAIVGGLLISLFSGSRVQIGGPTGAFIVIIYGIVQQYGYDGLATATLIAGVLLIVMGFARLGNIIKFIPYPVTIGFTSGIALIIFFTQVRDFFGLTITELPVNFIEKCVVYADYFSTINFYALLTGGVALLIVLYWPKVTRKIPGSLVAILFTTLLVYFLQLPVETIGTRFGSVPNMLPSPHLPNISWTLVTKMFSPAVTIALLAGIESLLSAVVADGMTGTRHRSNMELIAQGIANIGSTIFGGIPATGAIARTATNVKNGGRTPFAGMIHAITLLLIMLFFGKWATYIPMATLSAILIIVAYNMSEWRMFIKMFRSPKSDVAVLITTFLLTVLIDLTVAIEVGVVLAAFLFLQRVADTTRTGSITESLREEEEDENDPDATAKKSIPDGVEVFEIYGPFFFGAADQFKDALSLANKTPKVLILRMRYVMMLDATALRALEDVYEKTRKEKTTLILSGIHPEVRHTLQRAGLVNRIGLENLQDEMDDALARARQLV